MSFGDQISKQFKTMELFFVETVMGVSIDAMSKPDSDYIQAIIE